MSRKTIIAPESKKNPMVEVTQVQANPASEDSPEHKRALAKADLRAQFVTVADQIAENTLFFRNYKYQDADKCFPDWWDADYRFVTKCYPYARGGLLLVDECFDEKSYQMALKKHSKLKELKYRHIIIQEYYSEDKKQLIQTTVYDCLEQLGE